MRTTWTPLCFALALALWLTWSAGAALAEEPQSDTPTADTHVESTFIFTEENDSLAGTDNNYTNGTRFQWISGDISLYAKDHRLPQAAQSIIHLIPYLDRPDMQYNLGLSFGQLIYTPNNTKAHVYLAHQRPYAGWTYLSLALHAKTAFQLDTLGITLGMVGPSSLAGEAQNTVHRLMGIRQSQGWRNQLEDEPTVQLAWNRTLRTYRHDFDNHMAFDLLPHVGATAGNALILANAGFEMRMGYNLPWDFGTSLIRPGGGVSAPAPQDTNRPGKDNIWGAHVFVGADGRAVARNLFLDGNTFVSSHSVPKKYLVGDVMAGVGVQLGRVKLTYTQVLRTQEFEYQKTPQIFGSLGVSMTF